MLWVFLVYFGWTKDSGADMRAAVEAEWCCLQFRMVSKPQIIRSCQGTQHKCAGLAALMICKHPSVASAGDRVCQVVQPRLLASCSHIPTTVTPTKAKEAHSLVSMHGPSAWFGHSDLTESTCVSQTLGDFLYSVFEWKLDLNDVSLHFIQIIINIVIRL